MPRLSMKIYFDLGIDFNLNRAILLSTVSDWREPITGDAKMENQLTQFAMIGQYAALELGLPATDSAETRGKLAWYLKAIKSEYALSEILHAFELPA